MRLGWAACRGLLQAGSVTMTGTTFAGREWSDMVHEQQDHTQSMLLSVTRMLPLGPDFAGQECPPPQPSVLLGRLCTSCCSRC